MSRFGSTCAALAVVILSLVASCAADEAAPAPDGVDSDAAAVAGSAALPLFVGIGSTGRRLRCLGFIPVVNCFVDPCKVASCNLQSKVKGVVCQSNYCGGCNAEFFYNGQRLQKSQCCNATVECFADPCRVTSCPAFPYARCESNFCGGCNALFYVGNINVTPFCNNNVVRR